MRSQCVMISYNAQQNDESNSTASKFRKYVDKQGLAVQSAGAEIKSKSLNLASGAHRLSNEWRC